MVDEFKNTPHQKALNSEIELFTKHLRNDPSIKEVNFDHNEVTYLAGGLYFCVKFSALLKK